MATDESIRPDLIVRRMPFSFDDDINVQWNPLRPEWSYMVNGASLAMPYLEPYLIRTMRKALPNFKSARLIDDVKKYIGQEAQHYQQHRKFNDVLKENGYEELAAIEEEMAKDFELFDRQRSPKFNLAYAAGFESMALALGHWLINNREYLFAGSDTRVASLILWHFVEEIEHKCAAFDAYEELYGNYFYRVYGTLFATFHVMKYSRKAYIAMMKKDGCWSSLKNRVNLMKYSCGFLFGVAKELIHSFIPWHHPLDIKDPEWSVEWVKRYEIDQENFVYLDTNKLASPLEGG
jgi:predicted metal-dependent hydrolase